MKRRKVAIAPGRELQGRQHLFGLLSELYPVDFEVWRPEFSGDAALLWEGCPEEKEIAARNIHRLLIARPEKPAIVLDKKRAVQFTQSAALDSCFRNQSMQRSVQVEQG